MFDEVYKNIYQNLNIAQKRAVDSIEGPVMVIAGPGTGKTTILTLRIANILRQTDTPPSGILAITFTEAGAKAMRAKLKEVIGTRAHEVRIHTFHGFAASIISEFRDHFVHLDGVKQISDIESESIVRTILMNEKFRPLRPYANPDFYLNKILGAISDSKREAYTPEMVKIFADEEITRISNIEDSFSTRGKTKGELKADIKKIIEKCERTKIFAGMYEEYEKQKRVRRMMDFDDLIGELLITLRRDELLLRLLQEKFLYIHIDEHQDTNNGQNQLVMMLADFFDNPNVFIVGDEKQAIYRFQGASVENFLTFQHTWKDIKIIKLTDNYRSQQSILDASFEMIENNYSAEEYKDLRVKLNSANNSKPALVEVAIGEDISTSEEYLVKKLKEVGDQSVAVITKTNRDLERVLKLCEANDISISSERSIDIFSSTIGNLFFDIIEFLDDTSKTELLAKSLSAGLWGVSFDESINLVKAIRSGKSIEIAVINEIQKNMTGPVEYIIDIARLSSLDQFIISDPANVEVWRGIVTLCEKIVKERELEDPKIMIKNLIAYRATAENRSVKISIGTPDLKIKAMTAHSSKGLEFDQVFIPYATEESWVGRSWPNYFVLPVVHSSNDIADIRRLFYVAITRAKSDATILYGNEDKGETLTPLRFIDELAKDHIKIINLVKNKKEETFVAKTKNSKTKKYLEYAKSTLMTSGLSVTALNHFLECPSKFLYLSILKLPQAPSATAEKGTAMHLAISNIWRIKDDKNLENIEIIFKNTIDNYLEDSMLPLFEKQSAKKELEQIIPIVSRELRPHFELPGTIFSEIRVETQFNSKTCPILIHGKLDAVLDQVDEVNVFDYKTKQSMTENDIKGNTKNSNGNYFRQLVYYRYLLQNDIRFHKKNIIPALVFVVPNSKEQCPTIALPVSEIDVQKLEGEIELLLQSVWSGDFLLAKCEDPKCEWCNLKRATFNLIS